MLSDLLVIRGVVGVLVVLATRGEIGVVLPARTSVDTYTPRW